MARIDLPHSTFLDYTSHGTTDATSVVEAYGLELPLTPALQTINVALTLPRANDPSALLTSDWATRQTTLKALRDAGELWSTYGASQADYDSTLTALGNMGIKVLGLAGDDGYVTSAESRTVWVQLDPAQFEVLFGTQPYQSAPLADYGLYFWEGGLSLPDSINATGIWFDTTPIWGQGPATSDMSGGATLPIVPGEQSIGNALYPLTQNGDYKETNFYAGAIARNFYNFPLADQAVATKTIGLVEPGIGAALPGGSKSFQDLLDGFREGAGIDTPGSYYLVAHGGQSYELGNSGERSLDIGFIASATPNSAIGLYAGSGFKDHAQANSFTAFQSAFWDEVNDPSVISSSFSIFPQSDPDSPFASAVRELFVDAALMNRTVAFATNDFGSSWSFGNGLANVSSSSSSPFALLVGGTSLTTLGAAPRDPTVSLQPNEAASLYGLAMANDPATLWRLMQGGLNVLPSAVAPDELNKVALLESVWNILTIRHNDETGEDHLLPAPWDLAAGDGGVDTSQPTPWYQTAFGLTPTSVNPGGGTGRGTPDVSANAGGNMFYITPTDDMTGLSWDEGTSAATPLWASLIAQIDTIFADQGLPDLGFANDLIYQAAAVAPAAFNDIVYGNNVSSYIDGGPVTTGEGRLTLTGYGYYAAPGYDLASGLGTPDGVLLARALSTIAHAQMYGATPDMIEQAEGGSWSSGADQSLLVQAMASQDHRVAVLIGDSVTDFASGAADVYGWTSRLAQQSLQADFDPELVRLFDRQSQGTVMQVQANVDDNLAVAVDSSIGAATQGALTSPFGFVDFVSADGAVRVARPVAIAETAGGADDQTAMLRLRQNGADDLSLELYRVDDLSGAIGGLHPGDPGYEAAAAARAYQLGTGDDFVLGPGYGEYGQTTVLGVDAGDIVAMKLTNMTTRDNYWSFEAQNETVDGTAVGHIWNYGLNTWGFEDTYGGGDHDFNDLLLQLDFTSTAGHGWLV
ncbi:hypothetical protein J2X65_000019 [Ancylobacter sp. 3268]|uniref:hypothetical protein n=1 Tax=Ancylobacter sp. 3268 TaxID=2817752 RepID=UPI0028633306|nr:hypothetical protein [Ancylobacter sp. 3268]MDR6950676.1 hypothetical protein [Ancylobacter sp. 3268]